jgi:DNA-binding CsgD family transcriptional regulator
MRGALEELEKAAALCGRISFLNEEATDHSELSTALLEPLSDFVRADMSVFRVYSVAHSAVRPMTVLTVGVPERVNDAYLTRYFRLDPVRHILQQRLSRPWFANERNPGTWLRERGSATGLAHALSPAVFARDFQRYRSEFLLPNQLRHHLGFCFQNEARTCTYLFDFHRISEATLFGKLELARARIAAPVLQQKITRLPMLHGNTYRARPPPVLELDDRLGVREREVAEAVALGLSNKEIASRLEISVRTVENHLRSIFAKLGVATRTQLAAKLHQARIKQTRLSVMATSVV